MRAGKRCAVFIGEAAENPQALACWDECRYPCSSMFFLIVSVLALPVGQTKYPSDRKVFSFQKGVFKNGLCVCFCCILKQLRCLMGWAISLMPAVPYPKAEGSCLIPLRQCALLFPHQSQKPSAAYLCLQLTKQQRLAVFHPKNKGSLTQKLNPLFLCCLPLVEI
jgi:hypothetical protein